MSSGLSLRDKTILDFAARGKTAEDIAVQLQVPAARVVQEIDRLTNTVDWLDETQRYKLLTHNLWSLMGKLKDVAESGVDPILTKGYLDTIRLAFEQVEKQRELAEFDLDRVNVAQAKALMQIVNLSFYATLEQLQGLFPGVPVEQVEAQFKDNLLAVSATFEDE
jgi:hypothetical protein